VSEDPTLNPLSPSLAVSRSDSGSSLALDTQSTKALTSAIQGHTDAITTMDARLHTVLQFVAECRSSQNAAANAATALASRSDAVIMALKDTRRALIESTRVIEGSSKVVNSLREETARHMLPERVEVDVEVRGAPALVHRLADLSWPFIVSYYGFIAGAVAFVVQRFWSWL